MSSFLSEAVVRVPPLSKVELERVANALRQVLVPDGGRLDWQGVVDRSLPALGVHLYPADEAELGAREAATDPGGTTDVCVLFRPAMYDSLFDPGPRGNRARATAGHELGHVVLHVGFIRRLRRFAGKEAVLARMCPRADMRAFEDPEWQAWTFAGFLLMPRHSLLSMVGASIEEIAAEHGVSTVFARNHYKRMGLEVPKSRYDFTGPSQC